MAVIWRIVCNLKRYYRVKNAAQRLESSSSNRNMARHKRDMELMTNVKWRIRRRKKQKHDVEGNQIEGDVINGMEN